MPAKIEMNIGERVAALHKTADRIYERWCAGLARA
jgi:hypothetical protein